MGHLRAMIVGDDRGGGDPGTAPGQEVAPDLGTWSSFVGDVGCEGFMAPRPPLWPRLSVVGPRDAAAAIRLPKTPALGVEVRNSVRHASPSRVTPQQRSLHALASLCKQPSAVPLDGRPLGR